MSASNPCRPVSATDSADRRGSGGCASYRQGRFRASHARVFNHLVTRARAHASTTRSARGRHIDGHGDAAGSPGVRLDPPTESTRRGGRRRVRRGTYAKLVELGRNLRSASLHRNRPSTHVFEHRRQRLPCLVHADQMLGRPLYRGERFLICAPPGAPSRPRLRRGCTLHLVALRSRVGAIWLKVATSSVTRPRRFPRHARRGRRAHRAWREVRRFTCRRYARPCKPMAAPGARTSPAATALCDRAYQSDGRTSCCRSAAAVRIARPPSSLTVAAASPCGVEPITPGRRLEGALFDGAIKRGRRPLGQQSEGEEVALARGGSVGPR